MDVWVAPGFLAWKPTVEGTTRDSGEGWKSIPYDELAHAEDLLGSEGTDRRRGDAVAALRRAVRHRVEILKKVYELRRIPIADKPRDDIELLQYLGIIRPLMLRTLVEVRDSFEHEYLPPPSRERCRELAEIVWYFLRSTERLVHAVPVEFALSPDGDTGNIQECVIKTGPMHDWNLTISVNVDQTELSSSLVSEWMRVILDDDLALELEIPGWIWFQGQVRGPASCIRALIRLYFDWVIVT
ncbi:MAG: hypothetical protein JWL57_3089 [Actinobacteria bacterium]|jgi:hypothetical protein|nr:hypothetical protein [Actinomycetota bacterium]